MTSKENDFSTVAIESRLCDFLLVVNSNIGPILHHFGIMATSRPKIANVVDTSH